MNARTTAVRKQQQLSSVRPLFVMALIFFAGYFSASVLTPTDVLNWYSKNIQHELENKATKLALKKEPKKEIPKPTFEFYTLLTNELEKQQQQDKAKAELSKVATTTTTAPEPAKPAATKPQSTKVTLPVPSLAADSRPKPIPAKVAPVTVAVPANKLPNRAYFHVQAASYQSRSVAEQTKAKLILAGFDVRVVEVAANGTRWYRVMIGPFSSKEHAEHARLAVARNYHISGLVRQDNA